MITLKDVTVRLPGFTLEPLSVRVEEGEFFMLVGPSGAGKTMLLESIAGLQPLASGTITVSGRDITAEPPERRGIALVYQDYALFPHLSVEQNIRYGLRFADERDENHVAHLIETLRLDHLLRRNPETLSGGEQQRVALARALAVKPSLLLLDEPLSSLDPRFREELQEHLRSVHEAGVTILMVTHDFGEVLSLGNQVAVLQQGRLQQKGGVAEVFHTPANREVAAFVGMKNIFQASLHGRYALLEGGTELLLGREVAQREGFIGIRPENIILAARPGASDAVNCFWGRIISVTPRDVALEVLLETADIRLFAHVLASSFMELGLHPGETACMRFKPEAVHIF
ncbi:MAG: ABC transporter ATP-binding protein [Synergistales bacterium]|nr:ABC transporter ATP-binding protein [Synergistales bacterium]